MQDPGIQDPGIRVPGMQDPGMAHSGIHARSMPPPPAGCSTLEPTEALIVRETLEEKLRKEDTAAELLNGHSVANLLKDFARHFSQQAVPATVQQAVAAGSGGGRGPLGMLQADDEAEQVCAGGGGERAYVWGGGVGREKMRGGMGAYVWGTGWGGGERVRGGIWVM